MLKSYSLDVQKLNETTFCCINVVYSGDLKSRHVIIWNGLKEVGLQLVGI